MSLLTTNPVSLRPALSNCFFNSLANLLVLPSRTASSKFTIFLSISSGGKRCLCLCLSCSIKEAIASSGNSFSSLSLLPNS